MLLGISQLWLLLSPVACSTTPPPVIGPVDAPTAENAHTEPLTSYAGFAAPLPQPALDACGTDENPPPDYAIVEVRTDALLFAGTPVATPAEAADLQAPPPKLIDAITRFGKATAEGQLLGCLDERPVPIGGGTPYLIAADRSAPIAVLVTVMYTLARYGGGGRIDLLVADPTPTADFPTGGGTAWQLHPTGDGVRTFRAGADDFDANPVPPNAVGATVGPGADVMLLVGYDRTYADLIAVHDQVAATGGRVLWALATSPPAQPEVSSRPAAGAMIPLAPGTSFTVLSLVGNDSGSDFPAWQARKGEGLDLEALKEALKQRIPEEFP